MENNASTPDRESRRTSSRIRGNDQSRNEIPILNKTIQNINNSKSMVTQKCKQYVDSL